jgi:hypothetical protein
MYDDWPIRAVVGTSKTYREGSIGQGVNTGIERRPLPDLNGALVAPGSTCSWPDKTPLDLPPNRSSGVSG